MGNCKNLSDFHKIKIVLNRRLGQSIYSTAGLLVFSQYVVPKLHTGYDRKVSEHGAVKKGGLV